MSPKSSEASSCIATLAVSTSASRPPSFTPDFQLRGGGGGGGRWVAALPDVEIQTGNYPGHSVVPPHINRGHWHGAGGLKRMGEGMCGEGRCGV